MADYNRDGTDFDGSFLSPLRREFAPWNRGDQLPDQPLRPAPESGLEKYRKGVAAALGLNPDK